MAKNTGRGSRVAAGLTAPIHNGMWTRNPNQSQGQFVLAKTYGGTFRGIPRSARREAR